MKFKKGFKILAALVGLFVISIALIVYIGFSISANENKIIKNTYIYSKKLPDTFKLEEQVYSQLPNPVQKYFKYAFNGKKEIQVKYVEWNERGNFTLPVGHFNTKAQQSSITSAPIYIWDGKFYSKAIPFMPFIESRDAFMLNQHNMRAKLLGLIKVMKTDYLSQREKDLLHSNLILRYYGTALNFPWALLPSKYVYWEAIDHSNAYLILNYNNYKGRYKVTFGSDGKIIKMETTDFMLHGNDGKLKEIAKKSNYKEINGFMVPTKMDYSWFREDGVLDSHYEFEITSINYVK